MLEQWRPSPEEDTSTESEPDLSIEQIKELVESASESAVDLSELEEIQSKLDGLTRVPQLSAAKFFEILNLNLSVW